jgi:hypothetical protein
MTQLISQGGQKNTGFTLWDTNQQYRPGDMVVYNSEIYTTLQNIPAGSAWGPEWTLAVLGGPTTGFITGTTAQDYQVTTTVPTTRSTAAGSTPLIDGDFWFDPSNINLKVWNGDVSDWVLAINSVPTSLINGLSSVQVEPSSNIGFVVAGSPKLTLTSNGAALRGYTETAANAAFSTTILPNVDVATIQRFTATANFTFNGFTNPVTGQSATIIITQDATGGRVMTSTMLFAGGLKTLSTGAGECDIISVFYDGINYYASLTKGYV